MSSYTQDFRDEVIARVISSNEPVSHIAARYGVAKCTVYSWVNAFRYSQESGSNVVIDSMTEHDIAPEVDNDFKRLYLAVGKRLEQQKQKICELERGGFFKKSLEVLCPHRPIPDRITMISSLSFRSKVLAHNKNYVRFTPGFSSKFLSP